MFRILSSLLLLLPLLPVAAQEVHSYASQVNDVDAVNSHWFETADGVVLIDAQRILPEAERALRHLRATTAKPVTAIFITHPHTDHYGGLPVWKAAYPDAVVYATAATLRSIREDSRGYNAARSERHGERFAGQAALDAAVAGARSVEDGQRVTIGGGAIDLREFGPSEAESTLVLSVAGGAKAFIGDLVNIGVPAVPFESVDNWLAQLVRIERLYTGSSLYQGHGPAPIDTAAVADQRRFLTALRDLVASRVGDRRLSAAEQDEIVFTLEARWPFYMGVAGNTRQEILAFGARLVAEQMGAVVE